MQIGIFNVPEQTLAKHKTSGWYVVESLAFDGDVAYGWEQRIPAALRNRCIGLPRLRAGGFDGYTEPWERRRTSAYAPRCLSPTSSPCRSPCPSSLPVRWDGLLLSHLAEHLWNGRHPKVGTPLVGLVGLGKRLIWNLEAEALADWAPPVTRCPLQQPLRRDRIAD